MHIGAVSPDNPGIEIGAENNLGYEQAFALQEYPMPVANKPDF